MDSFKAVSRYMQDSPTFHHDMWFLVVAIIGLTLLWTGITLWDRYRATNVPVVPRYETLFIELCQAHKLPDGESQWLQNLADRNGFDDPARLFFTPQTFQAEFRSDGENASKARMLFDKLFGSDAGPES